MVCDNCSRINYCFLQDKGNTESILESCNMFLSTGTLSHLTIKPNHTGAITLVDAGNANYTWRKYNPNTLREIVLTESKKTLDVTMPKKVIQNDKATILIWEDGTKTIVKCSADDTYSKEYGFLAAYFEKHSGLSKTQISKYMQEVLKTGDI